MTDEPLQDAIDALADAFQDRLGPTGRYPQGKLKPDDDGELTMAVGVQDGIVVLDFQIAVTWLGLTPDDVDAWCVTLAEKAAIARQHPRWSE